jgi:Putative methyltransferase
MKNDPFFDCASIVDCAMPTVRSVWLLHNDSVVENDSKDSLTPCSTDDEIVVPVLVTRETGSYRQLAVTAVTTSGAAAVVEIGCSTGGTLESLWKACGDKLDWIGLDNSLEMVRTVQAKIEAKSVTNAACVYQVNVLSDSVAATKCIMQHLAHKSNIVVFLVDIGGNRALGPVLRTVAWVLDELIPSVSSRTTIIVKNQDLAAALQQAASEEWFRAMLQSLRPASFPHHPLKAPRVMSPLHVGVPICRYHNYHAHGCFKFSNENAASCPFDHEHCHWCLEPGHIALQCRAAQPHS